MKPQRRRLLYVVFLLVCSAFCFREIGSLLSASDVPGKADVIICLSGSEPRIHKAAELLRAGVAVKILTTTAWSYRQMLATKVNPEQILQADWSAASTYEEGLLIKSLLVGSDYNTAVVVSDPFHLCRARWTLRRFFPDNSVAFSFVSSEDPSLNGFWWSNPNSRLFVLSEVPKIVYYWVWHGLLGISKDPVWAVELERIYMAFVRVVFFRPMA